MIEHTFKAGDKVRLWVQGHEQETSTELFLTLCDNTQSFCDGLHLFNPEDADFPRTTIQEVLRNSDKYGVELLEAFDSIEYPTEPGTYVEDFKSFILTQAARMGIPEIIALAIAENERREDWDAGGDRTWTLNADGTWTAPDGFVVTEDNKWMLAIYGVRFEPRLTESESWYDQAPLA